MAPEEDATPRGFLVPFTSFPVVPVSPSLPLAPALRFKISFYRRSVLNLYSSGLLLEVYLN
jgi:hypothetical protein